LPGGTVHPVELGIERRDVSCLQVVGTPELNTRIRSGQGNSNPIEITVALRSAPLDQVSHRVEASLSSVPLGQLLLVGTRN
jgi:hypothetical protein